MSVSEEFLKEVLQWHFVRTQRHYELLSTVLKVKGRLRQLEQTVVQTGRALLTEELTEGCMMALNSVWVRTGVAGCWTAWCLSLAITWLSNSLNWTAREKRSSRTDRRKRARKRVEHRLQIQTLMFLSLMRTTQCMQADDQ